MSGLVDRLLRRRNRLPPFLNRVIDHVAAHPMGLLGRIAARRMGLPHDLPPVSVSGNSDIRLLIAPVNYSGQGRLWAASLAQTRGSIAAVNMAVDVPGGFSFPADLIVPVPAYHNSREWQERQFDAATRFTHVLVEAEEPLFGRLFGRDPRVELLAMLSAGIDVAFIAHGTDVRLPSRHAANNRWSPYRDPDVYLARPERVARENQNLLATSGRPVFVSTPDLLMDVPEAVWCPVVIDPAVWATDHSTRAEPGPLRVVHAPSSALIKGTHLIEPVLHRLHDRGIIEYRPIVGMPSSGMPEVFRSCDVVLDQFRIGSYGVAACEAMASGRTVIGHVVDEVRASVVASTSFELPVVEATPDTLEHVLVSIAENRAELAASRRAGLDFVRGVHDGRLSADVLWREWLAKGSVQPCIP
jgi:hypothetical protein